VFLRRLAGHFANETAVATPNGKVLSADPAAGLAKWQQLPQAERRRLEDLGRFDPKADPAPPRGGLILKVYARGLERDGAGRLQVYRLPRAHLSQEPGRDFLWLTEPEWRSLVPARAEPGQRLAVPPALVDRICRRYLIDLVRIGGEGGPRRPDQVLGQGLTLTVLEATPGAVRLRLDGQARYRTQGPEHGAPGKEGRVDEFRLLGFLDYDAATKVLTRFDAVALSETGHFDEIGRCVLPLGVAFELTRGQTPADRVRPSSFYQDYFGKRR
jgi:hypothetical protein